jgi:hypothetical protein
MLKLRRGLLRCCGFDEDEETEEGEEEKILLLLLLLFYFLFAHLFVSCFFFLVAFVSTDQLRRY